jgi:hypothetical protein
MIVEDFLAMFGVGCFFVGAFGILWLTWAATAAMPCVECGGEIAPVLERLGSIKCHDCR